MKARGVVIWTCVLVSPVWAQVIIENPKGGWRHGESEDQYTQQVNYPASSVNTPGGISAAALIQGRITNLRKNTAEGMPATLVVNGAAMPMRVDEDGRFSRPYAFGSGSNSVEVRAPGGGDRQRVQFFDTAANKKQSRLRIVLSWDSDGTDLDMHVITPSGEHAWYGDRVVASGGAIDVDVTTGYGPEIFSHPAPQKGVYLVYVNYYGAGHNASELTVAQVTIISNENTPSEKRQSIQVPMRRAGDLTLVSSFVYP